MDVNIELESLLDHKICAGLYRLIISLDAEWSHYIYIIFYEA